MDRPVFSVILPFYKQGDHMDRVIAEYVAGLRTLNEPFEVIIVVNGQSDAAEEMTTEIISQDPPITRIVLKKAGWGLAIRRGFDVAKGEYVCYTNTARTFVEDLINVLRYARVNDNAVIKGARLIRENTSRKIISFIYNLENRLLLHTPVLDVNATPKVIPKKILDTMTFVTDDELFCAELMYDCYEKSVPIIEVPVKWAERKGGKSTTNIKTAIKLSTKLPFLKRRIRSKKASV